MASPQRAIAVQTALPQDTNHDFLRFDEARFKRSFDREPFPFQHELSGLDLFRPDALQQLAEKMGKTPRDYFVAGSAAAPGTKFYDVPSGGLTPAQALEGLDERRCRILLKRPENHERGFRELLEMLFQQVMQLRGGLRDENLVRLESAVLISSGSTTTPIHFDPEIGFFSQIEGEKFYHVYPPACAAETELERFYLRGKVDIGNVDLNKLDRNQEYIYALRPGFGFHQPQNAPHWVQTGEKRSVSYTFVFETDMSRARGRTRAFNYLLRKAGVTPSTLGKNPGLDAGKAAAFRAAKPLQFAGKVLNKAQRVLGGSRIPH
jgi:hypothetical protein